MNQAACAIAWSHDSASRSVVKKRVRSFDPARRVMKRSITRSGALDFRFFPAPSAIFETFWELVTSGTLWTDALATVGRVAIGFAMGTIPALALGLALGLWRLPRQILNPIFSALYPVPKIAIFPLLLLLLGVGEMSKYVIIAVVAFFLVFFNTLTGVLQIPRIYLDGEKTPLRVTVPEGGGTAEIILTPTGKGATVNFQPRGK